MKIVDRLKKSAGVPHPVNHEQEAVFLQVSGLNVSYDGVPALVDVSFEVEAGDRIAVVGPNGAGKSTLFKAIAGVMDASAGEVRLSGHRPRGHICIAYLPQRSEVDWSFPASVADVVMMGRVGKIGLFRNPKPADWAYVDECLAQVGLTHLKHHRINELSGGQQQRMFIAQALAQEAELLMMDEPLSGLDLPSQEEVFNILDLLQTRRVTVMVATHDLSMASDRFGKVLLLNRRLIGYGKPEQIFGEQQLRQAYGGHLQVIHSEDGVLVLTDTCCDEGEMHA